jgi:prevent-host-death family protein
MMERFVGVEEARAKLGDLVDEVAEKGVHVALTKRGRPLAMIVGREEYGQLKALASERARERLAKQLTEARRRVKAAGLDPEIVDEAIRTARQSM